METIPKTARGNSVKTRRTEPPRSLSRSVLCQAKQIVAKYSIIVEPNDDLGFMGTSVELPTVFGRWR